MIQSPTIADVSPHTAPLPPDRPARLRRRRPGRCNCALLTLDTLLAALIVCFSPAGCEKEEPPPPPQPPATAPAPAEIDRKHTATVKADRSITVPNLQLVIQRDPMGADMTGFTLLSTRPGADGSRLLLGTAQSLISLDKLTSTDVRFAGARFLDTRGNGIFTSMRSYQPKFVTLRITAVNAGEASGTISGEFYRFKTGTPAARPDVVELEATFTAVLTVR
jgi:hypothetical protein